MITFLELDSYIEPPVGFPDRPYFDEDLWPLILRRSDEIRTVIWFQHEGTPAGGHRLVDLGPITKLSAETIEMLKHRSFYGGHLNVLYVVHAETPLLIELVKLYPRAGIIASDSEYHLGFSPESRLELERFVESLPTDLLVLAFAHDGDPAYIFGARESLEQLLSIQLAALQS